MQWKGNNSDEMILDQLLSSNTDSNEIENIVKEGMSPTKQEIKTNIGFDELISQFILAKAKVDDKDVENFWNKNKPQFNFFYIKYKKYSSILISNGAVERLFSRCKFFSAWKKNRISAENLQTRIVCNENSHLCDKLSFN